ncbi:MAG: FkbM family methyltransferase [Acidobacteria bacterium]|nr:FkbM family methyltransferase [Acidobacteriota bacterium]
MRLPPDLGSYRFHCDLRDSVAREVCFTGRYEPQETSLAARLLRPGMTVVDVGANWGYFTLAAAHWVGRTGRVMAFEPEPRLFDILTRNCELNALAQVRARRKAVAKTAGRLSFRAYVEEAGNWGVTAVADDPRDADFECEAVGLDAALDAEAVEEVDVVKVDVEGAEADVLTGMSRGLAAGRYRYVILECHPEALHARALSVAEAISPLARAGYRLWTIDHSPRVHRLAAAGRAAASELLSVFDASAGVREWPHILAAAPGAPAPS